MKPLPLSLVLTSMCLSAALAQQSDSDAILKAIQGIGSRLDGMQKSIDDVRKDVDKLKVEPPSQPSAPSQRPSNSAIPISQPSNTRVQPGWVIDVFPRGTGSDPARIMRFSSAKSPISLMDHQKIKQTQPDVYYLGTAKLNLYDTGVYIFEIEHEQQDKTGYFRTCSGSLEINGSKLVEFKHRDARGTKRIFNGKSNLASGNYDVKFQYDCDDETGRVWFKIMGPSDNVARELTGKDIFHNVTGSSSINLPATPLPPTITAGTTRTITAEVNVRNQPGATSPVSLVGKLQPGQHARVANIIANGPNDEWAQIEVNGRAVGFIKTTALAANSQ